MSRCVALSSSRFWEELHREILHRWVRKVQARVRNRTKSRPWHIRLNSSRSSGYSAERPALPGPCELRSAAPAPRRRRPRPAPDRPPRPVPSRPRRNAVAWASAATSPGGSVTTDGATAPRETGGRQPALPTPRAGSGTPGRSRHPPRSRLLSAGRRLLPPPSPGTAHGPAPPARSRPPRRGA